jgi:CPA2 family monovalent cation:H+ antiporter-2
MVRTRDESHVQQLRRAGATEVVPETLEAGMMIVSHALLLLDVPLSRVMRRMRSARAGRYRLLTGLFGGADTADQDDAPGAADRLHSIPLPENAAAAGCRLSELTLEEVRIEALLRNGERIAQPAPDTMLATGDVLVLSGTPASVARAERRLLAAHGRYRAKGKRR